MAGSVSVSSSDAVVDGFLSGWIGVVEANTGPEIRRGSAEVFHGFWDYQQFECANGDRVDVPTTIGYLAAGRTVRVVEMVNDRVSVEDIGAVDCDMVTEYDVLLEFDDERIPCDFDDRGEDPDAYSVYDDHCDSDYAQSSGSVVDMCARTVQGLLEKRVRRSNVCREWREWLPVDCFYKHSLHAQFGVDSTS